MTNRQLRKLAQRIAELEKIIQINKNQEVVKKAQRKIISLCTNLETDELWYLDELIQEILELDS